jgi:hypothetical protein
MSDRAEQLLRARRALVSVRRQLQHVQSYHAADLVAAVIRHLDRKDDARGNVREVPQ